MTDNWDSYLCQIEEKPASMLVDLGVVEHAPLAKYPCMGYVIIDLKKPDENGFPGREEYAALAALEDSLEDALTGSGAAVFVGRCTTNGRSDLIFYTTTMKGWDERVSSALLGFPSYSWETGVHDDPEWSTYFDFLYPGEADLLCIRNRRVCRQLEEQGDDLAKERPLDHWLDFATLEGRTAFAAEARSLGFVVEEINETLGENGVPFPPEDAPMQPSVKPGPDFDEAVLRLRLIRSDSPENIDEVTLTLAELAERFEGYYEGWGSPLMQ